MSLSRTNTHSSRSRSRSRSPQPPLPNQQLSGQYFPPSHYAAAGGFTFPEESKHARNDEQATGTQRSPYMPYLSPHAPESLDFQSNYQPSTTVERIPEDRKRRESQYSNLPLVESQLLPSLRDTIDRMTRPPSRAYSKASPSTPTFKISPDVDSYWPIATDALSPPSTSSFSSRPHTPVLSAKSIPDDHVPISPEPSTPKPIHSTPKNALKSALRSPNPKLKTDHVEPIAAASTPGVTLKSVRSLLRRKSSTSNVNAAVKPESKENKSPESFSVLRGTSRSRSRTDPGTRLPLKEADIVSIPLPATLQPPSSNPSKSFTSNIPRFCHNYAKGVPATSDDSDLEYRFELEARQRRRLTVTNAKIPSCSSGSESEDSIVLSPATEPYVRQTSPHAGRERIAGSGMGLHFSKSDVLQSDGLRDIDRLTARDSVKHESMNTYASAGSIYTDAEPEELLDDRDAGMGAGNESNDALDEKHLRRRRTLMGIVRGLDLRGTANQRIMSGDESEYHGEPGLAVSASGDVQPLSPQVESESESEYEEERAERSIVEPIGHRSRSKDPPTLGNGHVSAFGRRPGRSPVPSRLPKIGSDASRTRSPRFNDGVSSKGSNLPSTSLKKKSSRHDTESKLNPLLHALSPPLPPQGRDSFTHFESVVIAKQSREVVARGREALGIPPSGSDEVYQTPPTHYDEYEPIASTIPPADSIVSDIDADTGGNECDEGELSMGAEALFRTLSGGSGSRRDSEEVADRSNRTPTNISKSKRVDGDSQETARHRLDIPSLPRTDSRHIQVPLNEQTSTNTSREHLTRGSWRSTLSSTTYTSLLQKHGDLEMSRQDIIWEYYRSEVDFVEKMGLVVKRFILPLRAQNSKTWISGVPLEIAKILDWLEDIVTLHTQIRDTLTGIQAASRPIVESVAEPICPFVHKLEIYQPYLVKIDAVCAMLRRLLEDDASDFGEFVRLQEREMEGEGHHHLLNLLEEPVKRLELYPTLFKQLLDTTPTTHRDYLSTLALKHCTTLMIKALTEVKTRENEYQGIKDISQRLVGLPNNFGLARRERRLLCQGQVDLLENSSSSSSVPTGHPSGRIPRMNRLANAINEWNAGRARSGSNASNATFASTNTTDSTSTFTNLPKSPLSEQYSSRASPLHFEEKRTLKPTSPILSSTSAVHLFLFTDLMILAQARAGRSKTWEMSDPGNNRWSVLEDIGLTRVLNVEALPLTNEDSEAVTIDVVPIRMNDTSPEAHVQTIYLNLPQDMNVDVWMRGFRQSSKTTLAAVSDPLSMARERSLLNLNDALDRNVSRALETLVASGLPLPKSPSMQLDVADSDLVKLEREERGWWSIRFQQVLKEIQDEDKLQVRY